MSKFIFGVLVVFLAALPTMARDYNSDVRVSQTSVHARPLIIWDGVIPKYNIDGQEKRSSWVIISIIILAFAWCFRFFIKQNERSVLATAMIATAAVVALIAVGVEAKSTSLTLMPLVFFVVALIFTWLISYNKITDDIWGRRIEVDELARGEVEIFLSTFSPLSIFFSVALIAIVSNSEAVFAVILAFAILLTTAANLFLPIKQK